ncbi:hypothetical protein BX666DRAFT_402909 [Dichotomocladium elegans]|nr:hypothetical protein BX666DRAFT_402909 [Dichotomocladium elegans]
MSLVECLAVIKHMCIMLLRMHIQHTHTHRVRMPCQSAKLISSISWSFFFIYIRLKLSVCEANTRSCTSEDVPKGTTHVVGHSPPGGKWHIGTTKRPGHADPVAGVGEPSCFEFLSPLGLGACSYQLPQQSFGLRRYESENPIIVWREPDLSKKANRRSGAGRPKTQKLSIGYNGGLVHLDMAYRPPDFLIKLIRLAFVYRADSSGYVGMCTSVLQVHHNEKRLGETF